jgi:hypothetical protein
MQLDETSAGGKAASQDEDRNKNQIDATAEPCSRLLRMAALPFIAAMKA